jgi:hypothetical protein
MTPGHTNASPAGRGWIYLRLASLFVQLVSLRILLYPYLADEDLCRRNTGFTEGDGRCGGQSHGSRIDLSDIGE